MLEALARAQEFEIPGTLPSLNQFIREQRANRYGGARMKAEAMQRVQEVIMVAHLQPMQTPCHVIFSWYMPNTRTDLDNVRFGSKVILDALVLQRIIPDDSMKYIVAMSDNFHVDRANPRIRVALIVAPNKARGTP
jgi:hypothetical protein